MALIGIQKQFTPKVESGEKRQTIRAPRKYPIKPREILHIYTGLRTKACRKLLTTICKSVDDINIYETGIEFNNDGIKLVYKYCLDNFAIADGFNDYEDMLNWFKKTHELPFKGQLIKW